MKLDSLDKLPEDLRDQFVEVEEDGKKYYQDKDAVDLKNLAFNVKNENKTLKEKLAGFDSKLSEIEEAKKREIEEAREKALQEARTKGDVTAIEERYTQQMNDLKKRTETEIGEYKSKLDALHDAIKSEKRSALVANLSSEMAVSGGAKTLSLLLQQRIDIDPETGKTTFLDANGGATSLDLDGFKKEIQNDELFAPLLKSGVVTQGGGKAQGSGSGAGANRKFNEYSAEELVQIRKQDQAKYDRLKSEFYN